MLDFGCWFFFWGNIIPGPFEEVFPIDMGIFHCYVSLPEDKIGNSISIFICSQTVGNIHVAK